MKTAWDTAAYGLGYTDEVKGTGVWCLFTRKREISNDEDNHTKRETKDEPKAVAASEAETIDDITK